MRKSVMASTVAAAVAGGVVAASARPRRAAPKGSPRAPAKRSARAVVPAQRSAFEQALEGDAFLAVDEQDAQDRHLLEILG